MPRKLARVCWCARSRGCADRSVGRSAVEVESCGVKCRLPAKRAKTHRSATARATASAVAARLAAALLIGSSRPPVEEFRFNSTCKGALRAWRSSLRGEGVLKPAQQRPGVLCTAHRGPPHRRWLEGSPPACRALGCHCLSEAACRDGPSDRPIL